MDAEYAGPIIDAHHHLWDLEHGHYPWLTRPDAAIAALGDIAALRRSYLPDDYAADIAEQGIVASVHAEAVWDPARSPVEETRWLDSLPRPPGIAARYIVAAPLGDPALPRLLEQHAVSPRVAAVRATIRWHPDPAKRWTRRGIVDEPAWRQGLSALRRYGWALDLLMNPHQAEEVARLAQDVPEQSFVINHIGTPNDRDAEGLARWRRGLGLMGAQANVALKLSNFGAYSAGPLKDRDTLRACIDAFGPDQCMFASDYPVARRFTSYADLCRRFRAVAAEYSAAEQEALFFRTAQRVYAVPLDQA